MTIIPAEDYYRLSKAFREMQIVLAVSKDTGDWYGYVKHSLEYLNSALYVCKPDEVKK